ncbi:VanZ family protein [Paenibacillus sp. GCM10023248]|uniref:VanZ family protein n=1 Tax=Bacillales TaxID=1385 RepID=UPI0023781BFB|nr:MULTISPECIES: VanZ family protein [Bacillales]MDD9265778.1 VanZ family protein [Paenibacillus sp. MAHUQ-63]MDR6879019.1 VanZ family protein [Bacillus sp. 3255]
MQQSSSKFYFYAFTVAAVLWMAFIFFKSGETYQQQTLRPLLEAKLGGSALFRHFPRLSFTYDGQLVSWQDPVGVIEFFIRKAGHVSEYAILALLWIIALLAKPVRVIMTLVTSSIISVLYAASDEWHQTFVDGRTGHAIDVVVDTIGVLLAVLVVLAVLGIRARIKRRRISW